MQHLCPRPACGLPMMVRGRPPKRYSAADGEYVFCPRCGRLAQVLGKGWEFIYCDVPELGSCSHCGRLVPVPVAGRRRTCVACGPVKSTGS